MSRINRTRSTAAGVEVAMSDAMASEAKGQGAAAAKSRHANSLAAQQATAREAPHIQSASGKGLPKEQAPKSEKTAQQQALLSHQGSINENALEDSATPDDALATQAAAKQPSKALLAKAISRSRSLPPKAQAPQSSKAAKPAKPAAQPAAQSAAQSAAQAAAPQAADPPLADYDSDAAQHPLSDTLAGLAQGLAASRQRRPVSTAVPAAMEVIDLDGDLANDSGDSDFQPEDNSDAAISDVEVIDLSQEDPLDVVEQPNGLVSIRSPEQAAAGAAVAAASGTDDDEEEFQRLAGKGKRKQPAKAAADEGEGTC